MKTQVIVSSKAFRKFLKDVYSNVDDEDIVFAIRGGETYAGDMYFPSGNQKGYGEYCVSKKIVKRLIKTLKIIPIQPVKLIFEGNRIGIECQF